MMCYHRLMIQWRFTKRVKEQMEAFRNVSYNNDMHNQEYLIYLVYTCRVYLMLFLFICLKCLMKEN